MKSDVIFVKFPTRFQRSDEQPLLSYSCSYSSIVLDEIPIHEDEHEDEDEKKQIRSHAYACLRAIVMPGRDDGWCPQPYTLYPIPCTLYRVAPMKLQFLLRSNRRFGGQRRRKL